MVNYSNIYYLIMVVIMGGALGGKLAFDWYYRDRKQNK
jgi:hypothetical protein